MVRYKDLEKYLTDMITFLLGNQATSFNFSENSTERVIVERQNVYPMPDVRTIATLRVDRYDAWRSLRYGHSTVYYDKHGAEHISELRTCRVYLNVLSKELGDAFDATRFIIANLQNNRYNEFVRQKGRLLGIENISSMKNLSDLENGSWTERIHVEFDVNFKDDMVINEPVVFVKTPETISDVSDSVDITTEMKK
jgi:hypothetical protein